MLPYPLKLNSKRMTRILVLSLLLTMVYSWEEFKRAVRVLILPLFRRLRRRTEAQPNPYLDQQVSTLVLVATLPFLLTVILAANANPFVLLTYLTGSLLLAALVAASSAAILQRMRMLTAAFQSFGFANPAIVLFNTATLLPRWVLAKLAFWMSVPPVVGLILKRAVDSSSPAPELLPNLNILIIVLVCALILRLAIELLEKLFDSYRLERLFSHFRVLLGIILASVLIAGKL